MKTLVIALAILASPATVLADCTTSRDQASMSCVEGSTWDDAAGACVPITVG